MIDEMGKLTKEIRDVNVTIERVDKRVSTLIGRVEKLESDPANTEETEVAYDSDGLPYHKQIARRSCVEDLKKIKQVWAVTKIATIKVMTCQN
jgi:hypothetical protein